MPGLGEVITFRMADKQLISQPGFNDIDMTNNGGTLAVQSGCCPAYGSCFRHNESRMKSLPRFHMINNHTYYGEIGYMLDQK